MFISRVVIKNFRNLRDFAVELQEKAVLVGENGIGKSNFFEALKFALDSSYRVQLQANDFSRGCVQFKGSKIEVHVWFTGFDIKNDKDLLSCAHDCRVSRDGEPLTVKLSAIWRARPNVKPDDAVGIDQYEPIWYGGDDENNTKGATRFRDFLRIVQVPALRDIDRDMQSWRLSPMRRLVESMNLSADADFVSVVDKVTSATSGLRKIDAIRLLQEQIQHVLSPLVDDSYALNPVVGLLPSNPGDLQRMLTLYVEGDMSLDRTSLGLSNVLYLVVLLVHLESLRHSRVPNQVPQYPILIIEEPEAHLHPHLQRIVFKDIFNRRLPLLVSTHSPTIVSLAEPEWLAVFKRGDGGTTAASSAGIAKWDSKLRKDLHRFLDATRGEVIFARGVLLVEGDAEMFLIPAFADVLKKAGIMANSLDGSGISVCNVFGSEFALYIKFLGPGGLQLPVAVLTDGDPSVGLVDKVKELLDDDKVDTDVKRVAHDLCSSVDNGDPVALRALQSLLEKHGHGHYEGLKRGTALGKEIESAIEAELNQYYQDCNWDVLRQALEKLGIFVNEWTLEDELIKAGYNSELVEVYADLGASQAKQNNLAEAIIQGQTASIIRRIETTGMGKGRFAQRLADRLVADKVPPYIYRAIEYLKSRVPKPAEYALDSTIVNDGDVDYCI